MKKIVEGTLTYNSDEGRYCMRYGVDDFTPGFHCGECFDVWDGKKWIPTRIEMGDEWYLVGLKGSKLNGMKVRMLRWV